MKPPWSLVPMLFPAAAVAAGILLHRCGAGELTLAILGAAALASIIARQRLWAVPMLGLAAGLASAIVWSEPRLPERLEGRHALYSGIVTRITEHDETSTVTLRVDSVEHRRFKPFTASVTVPAFAPGFEETDRVELRVALSTPVSVTDLPDEIDPAVLRKGNAAGFAPVDSFTRKGPEPGLRWMLMRERRRLASAIHHSGMADGTTSFLSAVLTGDTSAIDDDTRSLFASAGLSHMLALSGLHVGLIAVLASLMLAPLFPSPAGKARRLALIAVIWLFATATGLSASVTRASIMATVLILGAMTGQRHSPFNSLLTAVLIILVADPDALFSPGFQLSVAAVAGIMAATMALRKLPERFEPWQPAMMAVAVPVSATAATLLISLYHFHRLPVHFLGANIIASWLLPLLMVAGIAATLTHWGFLIGLTDRLYEAIDGSARFFSALPGCERLFFPTAAGVILACTMVFLVVYAVWHRRPLLAVPAAVAVIAWGCLEWLDRPADSSSAVYFARSRGSLDIVVRDHGRMIVCTTAPTRHQAEAVKQRCTARYSRFMQRRGIDSLTVSSTDFTLPGASRRGDTLTVGKRRFCLLTRNALPLPGGWKGVPVATSLFRGNIVETIGNSAVDTILISADMHPARAARFIAELHRAGYTPVDLRDQRLSYALY